MQVVSQMDSAVLLVYRLSDLLFARLDVRAIIPYVQDAILNMCHPYIVVAVATMIRTHVHKYCNHWLL